MTDRLVCPFHLPTACQKCLNPHPHIVVLHGAEARAANANGATEYLLLMEFCSRGTLAQAMAERQARGKPFAEKELLSIFLAVCSGVEHMHSQRPPIIHRDLKPENVLINEDSEYRLCDFGSCTTDARVHATPAEMGRLEEQVQKYTTSIYRAPEQVDPLTRQLVGTPVDVWALACILFSLCFFELPYPTGSAAQIAAAAYRIPRELQRARSPALLALLHDMFNVRPTERPSVTVVIDRVNEILRAPAYVPPQQSTESPLSPSSAVSASSPVSPLVGSAAAPKAKRSGKSSKRAESALVDAALMAAASARPASAAKAAAGSASHSAEIPPSGGNDWDAFGDDSGADADSFAEHAHATATNDDPWPDAESAAPSRSNASATVNAKANGDQEEDFDAFQSAVPSNEEQQPDMR